MTFLLFFSLEEYINLLEKERKALQEEPKRGKMLTVKGKWIGCPTCHRNRQMMQIRPDTEGRNIVAYCRVCKTEHIVDIVKGECFESYGQ